MTRTHNQLPVTLVIYRCESKTSLLGSALLSADLRGYQATNCWESMGGSGLPPWHQQFLCCHIAPNSCSHQEVPGLSAGGRLKASGGLEAVALLVQALRGRFWSGGWGTGLAAAGAQLLQVPGRCWDCSSGRWAGDMAGQCWGSAGTWSCPAHAMRRFTGG